jgi:hypothetical protein
MRLSGRAIAGSYHQQSRILEKDLFLYRKEEGRYTIKKKARQAIA